MRFFHVVLMTIALLVAGGVAQAQGGAFGGGAANVPATLVAESATPAPGSTMDIAFVMRPKPGWHGYWENPGDAGLGMTVKWVLPAGVTAGALRYPIPERLLISNLMNYVYEGPYAVLAQLKIPSTARQGDRLALRVRGDWLACTEQICVPEGDDLALDLTVGDGRIDPARRAEFDGYRMRLPRPLGATARYQIAEGKARIAIPFPADAAIAQPYFYPLSEGLFKYAAEQKVSRIGEDIIIEADAGSGGQSRVSGVLAIGPHRGLRVDAVSGTVAGGGSGGGLFVALLAFGGALLGGLILNVMPCVFPILSLKALSLAKTGMDAHAARREAIAYAAGVILTCVVLGGALLALRAGGAAVGWAFQLQDPRIILVLLALTTAVALNLAGVFELSGFGGGSGGKGGAVGAFWTGALVAFVATPCTGPFMAAALGAALVLPAAAALAIFAGLGIGLALPFVVIAFVPAIRARMPKPGRWMARLRHILSLPMFATALALAWLLGRQAGVSGMTLGLALSLVTGVLLWWMGSRQRRGKASPAILIAIGLALAAAVATIPREAPRAASEGAGAVPFSADKLAELRAAGKPVFLYFTADWCLTCKANEAGAIDRAAVTDAFRTAGVVIMVGDWTNGDPAISRFLEAHGRSGVPLYLWYAPGKDVQELPQLLTPTLLTELVA